MPGGRKIDKIHAIQYNKIVIISADMDPSPDFIELLSHIGEVGRKNCCEQITEVLKRVSSLCGADGCVLWLWTEFGTARRRLFPMTEWFRDQDTGFLGFLDEDSETAWQVKQGEAACFSPCERSVLPWRAVDPEFAKSNHVDSYCVIPVRWPEQSVERGTTAGAVNFYRYGARAFSDADFAVARQMASLLFQLTTDLSNRHAFELLRSVDQVLHRQAPRIEQPDPFSSSFEHKLTQLLNLVLTTFRCLEGSVYLQHPNGMETCIRRMAQVWPWKTGSKKSYEPEEGLTGYCFANKTPVCVFDLRRVKDDSDSAARTHWTEPIDVLAPVPGQERADGMLPPLAFLAVPIIDAGFVLGVLRCSVVRSAPYYFTPQQVKLLCMVANQAADWCGGTFRLWRAHQYVERMSRLNLRARESVDNHSRHNSVLYQQALETVAGAVPEAHSYCLRLLDPTKSRLKFECHYPDLDSRWNSRVADRQRSTSLSLQYKTGEASAAADAFNQKIVVVVSTFKNSVYKNLFFEEETDALVVAPVSCGSDRYGTIEVRFRLGEHISPHAVSMMRLLGQQLGLYIYLGERVEELDKSKTKLNTTVEVQREALETMEHQINSPLIKAMMKANYLSRELLAGRTVPHPELTRELLGLTGLIRQSKRVAASMDIFVALARYQRLNIQPIVLTEKTLSQRLTSAIHELNAADGRKVEFQIDSPELLRFPVLYLDVDLLDQMLDNLFDNAEKYGALNSKAVISYGITHQERFFYVSVASKGLPVTPQRASKLTERGERLDQAIRSGQEGHGLGLYIVNNIMKAHDGRLEILPTDKSGTTNFRLLFPIGPRRT
jgi:signal transduction histidine kinase